MANASVDEKATAKTQTDEPEVVLKKRRGPWTKQPSVLEERVFKIGKGEDDPVD